MFLGKFICHHCKSMFELKPQPTLEGEQAKKCPACGSVDTESLPSWVPLSYNVNLYDSPSSWQYDCHQCKNTFKMPVPSGPTEEKQRKCPSCGSRDIERLTVLVAESPLYCG